MGWAPNILYAQFRPVRVAALLGAKSHRAILNVILFVAPINTNIIWSVIVSKNILKT
jgi:hypothetical protein